MRISVAMTVRNGTRFLEPLLDSLARQTRAPDELVVHDDASEDGTPAILAAFARGAPFEVRAERSHERVGHVEGFLRAARLCSGEAVAFCDHDDVWLEHKLATCHDALERSDAQLVLHATRVVDADLREVAPPWPDVGPSRLVPPLGLTGLAHDAPGMAMVFRRSLLDVADTDARPPSRYGVGRSMLHDEWVLFLAGVLGPVQLIDEPLLLYRQHESNDSGWVRRTRQATLAPVADDYRAAAEHCEGCASYLAATRTTDPVLAARLEDGARHYAAAGENWRLRLALYRARDRRSRARCLRRLISARAYGSRSAGGFGLAALGKDVIGGVALRTGPGAR